MKASSIPGAWGRPRSLWGVKQWVLLAMLSASPLTALAEQPGDTEPNETVDLRDLLAIRNAFGQSGAPGFIGADVNDDGTVNNTDLLIWRQNYPFVGTPIAPYIFIANPLDGTLIGQRRPTVVIDYSPTTLNLDPSTLQVTVDSVDVTDSVISSSTNAALPIDVALPDGVHTVVATIEDTAGTVGTAQSDFEVDTIRLLPRAVPPSGQAPFTATFLPEVVWADDPPAHYLWDWDNNGTWDNGSIGGFDASARPDPTPHQFLEEGLHTVKFGVYQQGPPAVLSEQTLQVAVTETFASVSPTNGTAPLTVFLHGIAADLDDPIVLYEWDWDYSGTFSADYSSASNPNTAHVYVFPGIYQPVFRATHQNAGPVEYPIVTDELHVTGSGSPTAIASAAQGANALTVNFSGTGSDNGTITQYEWDFDNNGTYDYSSPTTGVVSHTYPAAGVKVAAFRVTDDQANTSVDRVRIETFAPATLEILDDTIEPLAAESTTVRTSTTIESEVWLYIKAADQILSTGEIVDGRVIRTLVDHVTRPAGTYNDTWDGLDDRFELTHPGAYYAVLEYTYPGRTDRIDLTNTTGGVQYFAPKLTPNPVNLNPFDDGFWDMTFQITSASRASLYILPGGSNRTATPFDNLPLGVGIHSYFWAGLNQEGQIAPSVNHLWTVNAWTLGDNAVVTNIRPEVENLQIDPNLYSPTDRPTGEALMTVNYECNRPAAVLAKVIRIDNGNTLRAIRTGFQPAGAQSFEWDGRGENGVHASPGDYSIAIEVVDEFGNISIRRFGLCRVLY